jgi:hypothetical protein
MPEKPSRQLLLVLIHEIAHAVTEVGHGAKWGRRMLAAAQTAKLVGEHELASMLRMEVESYHQSPKLRAADVYDRIAAAASEPGVQDFLSGINSVRQDLGLSDRKSVV